MMPILRLLAICVTSVALVIGATLACAHGVASGLRVAGALVVITGSFTTAVTFATILLLFTIATSAAAALVVPSLIQAVAAGARAVTPTLVHFAASAHRAVIRGLRLLLGRALRELWEGHGN